MSNDIEPVSHWFTAILAVFMSLLASIGEIYRRRVDKINENYVSKADLEGLLRSLRDDRQRMHQENLDSQREIRGSIERVHDRIDEIYGKSR